MVFITNQGVCHQNILGKPLPNTRRVITSSSTHAWSYLKPNIGTGNVFIKLYLYFNDGVHEMRNNIKDWISETWRRKEANKKRKLGQRNDQGSEGWDSEVHRAWWYDELPEERRYRSSYREAEVSIHLHLQRIDGRRYGRLATSLGSICHWLWFLWFSFQTVLSHT